MAQRYARTISADSIEQGVVPFDLYATDRNNRLVLFCRSGFELTEHHKKLLRGTNRLFYISSDDMDSYYDYAFEHLNRLVANWRISNEEKAKIVHGVGKRIIQRLLSEPRNGNAVKHSKRFIESHTDLILSSANAAGCLFAISSTDAYAFSHHINVATFCLLLGKKLLGNERDKLVLLGLGGLLHDIGLTQIDPGLINREGPLTDKEYETVQVHPVLGYKIARAHGLPEEVQLMVKCHHERYDGSGYPDGLKGEEIHPFARIVAAAEIYDAITSDRNYGKMKESVPALIEMSTDVNWFAPDVFEALLQIVLRNEELIEKFSRSGLVARPLRNVKMNGDVVSGKGNRPL
ncbi:MAG TPA: HD domain-containing phosphohydrolase [Acidobacteriota bacterium]|nr:HD domain-containing phosphohydrolase [Acidobacteriota bacterium]